MVGFVGCGGSQDPNAGEAVTSSSSSVLTQKTVSETTEQKPTMAAQTVSSVAKETQASVALNIDAATPEQLVQLHFESRIDDVASEALQKEALQTLNDPRGWTQAGFTFEAKQDADFKVILAEGSEVDKLCLPLRTGGTVSCQNGSTVALNADRWRQGVDHWDSDVARYRQYLVNHEVGHLLGQRHPRPRCPVPGRPAGVMEQQTGSLEGCTGNGWPRDWEIELASQRPVVYAPLPAWGPDPVPTNNEK